MKILKNGEMVFYKKAGSSASGLVFSLIVCAVCGGLFLATNNNLLMKIVFFLLTAGAGLMFLYLLLEMVIKKPLVRAGRDYLLLCGHRVFFEDIEAIYKYRYGPAEHAIEMIEIKVKDESKFPPTVMQKFALQMGHPLFIIAVGTMAMADAAALETALSNNIMPLRQGRNI